MAVLVNGQRIAQTYTEYVVEFPDGSESFADDPAGAADIVSFCRVMGETEPAVYRYEVMTTERVPL
jgi:hypothetical protein